MTQEFTIKVIDITGGLEALIGLHSFRYEIVNSNGKIVAACDYEDDANIWCYQWNKEYDRSRTSSPPGT
jgi:hypothetical protein